MSGTNRTETAERGVARGEQRASYRKAFRHTGYVSVPALLEPARVDVLWKYVVARARSGTLNVSDPQVPGTPSAYADPVLERLLEWLRPAIEDATGLELYPTYSYYRVYKSGDVLPKHRDRPACEVSVTLNLGQDPLAPWPLGIEGRQGAAFVDLWAGDAVIYRGTECPHWREPYTGHQLGQVFLHYVDRRGPHAAWRFDKRGALRLS